MVASGCKDHLNNWERTGGFVRKDEEEKNRTKELKDEG